MSNNFWAGFALVLIASLSWLALSQQPSNGQVAIQDVAQQWEYTVVVNHGDHVSVRDLNNRGSEGWDLVSAWSPRNRDDITHFILKRRKR